MRLRDELFFYREDPEKVIIYAPLQGTVVRVNNGVISLLQKLKKGESTGELPPEVKEQLIKSRILYEGEASQEDKQVAGCGQTCSCEGEYKPTSVTLLPTYNCNLRCVYCYSEAGENVGQIMDFDVARSSIDLIVRNALEFKGKNPKGNNRVSLSFHGGGEPLLDQNMRGLVVPSIEYFKRKLKENDLKGNVGCVTNAVLSQKNLEWVVQNFNSLNISLDGPEDIQNSQRPGINGRACFQDVMKTIRYLEEIKFQYGLRATITDASVSRMPEIVEFFKSISSNKSFHLEPLFECGRCKTSNAKAPTAEDFVKYMIEAKQVAKKLGVDIYYSGASLDKISEKFCGATGSNFFVTPGGLVTTCLEVCRPDDSAGDTFFIGRYDSEKKDFLFYNDRIKALRSRVVGKIPNCADCIAKFNCSGDCLAKVYAQSGNLYDTGNNFRCDANIALLIHELKQRLDHPEEYQPKEKQTQEKKAA